MFPLSETDKLPGVLLIQRLRAGGGGGGGGRATMHASWKICSRIQLSFGFWGSAIKACDNFSRKMAWCPEQYFGSFGRWVCLPGLQREGIGDWHLNKWEVRINLGGISRSNIGTMHLGPRMDDFVGKHAKFTKKICHHAKKLIYLLKN